MGLEGDWEQRQGTPDQAITPVELGAFGRDCRVSKATLKGLDLLEEAPAGLVGWMGQGLLESPQQGRQYYSQENEEGQEGQIFVPACSGPAEWEESLTKEQHPPRLLSPERTPTNPCPYSPCPKVSQFRSSLDGPGRHFWNCHLYAGA